MHQWVVNDPATESVFVKAMAFATDWSNTALVPPNVLSSPLFAHIAGERCRDAIRADRGRLVMSVRSSERRAERLDG
jgi:hypothetical protein